MKKIFLTLLALVPFCLVGQSLYDVYSISASYYQGTAKSVAMGNAMGAVGQDFSSISINPAKEADKTANEVVDKTVDSAQTADSVESTTTADSVDVKTEENDTSDFDQDNQ